MSGPKSKYIRIEEPRILKNRLLLSKISYSRRIEKYFQQKLFYVEYDSDIQSVSTSILQVPVFSNIITVAWAVGADVYVKELDKTYLESLNKIKSVMKRWYPKLSFSTDIHVENVVSNKFSNRGYGQLFSGGIDSTTSYIRHKNQKPRLIMVWGADIPLVEEAFWRKVRNKYKYFAGQENVEINFIKTNLREFINERPLDVEFSRYLTGSWWGALHHGIGLLGLCVPLTVVKHIGILFIAATHTQEFNYPWGSHSLIDNKLSWTDVKVVHDGYEQSRQEKIRRVLKSYIKNNRRYPPLRVCYSQFRDFNCSKCEKCCRTITGLVLENIDPNKCGFNINHNFFDFLKRNLIKGRYTFFPDEVFMWKDIQRYIPKKMSHNLYDSKEFFRWFRDFDVAINAEKRYMKINIKWWLFYIYYKLPKNARNAIAKLKLNENIYHLLFY